MNMRFEDNRNAKLIPTINERRASASRRRVASATGYPRARTSSSARMGNVAVTPTPSKSKIVDHRCGKIICALGKARAHRIHLLIDVASVV